MIRKKNVRLKKNNGYDMRSLVYHSIPFSGGAVKLENSLISKSSNDPARLQPGDAFLQMEEEMLIKLILQH